MLEQPQPQLRGRPERQGSSCQVEQVGLGLRAPAIQRSLPSSARAATAVVHPGGPGPPPSGVDGAVSTGAAVDRKSRHHDRAAPGPAPPAPGGHGHGREGDARRLACTVAARSCSSTPAFPATSSVSQAASKAACGWGVAPLAEADAAAASAIGPLADDGHALAVEGSERAEGRGHGALARGGLIEGQRRAPRARGQAGEIIGRDPDAGAGQPAAALHERRHLLDEGGQGGVRARRAWR